jgi:hypothetical protein
VKNAHGPGGIGPRRVDEKRPPDEEIDALFRLVPPEFVTARNALAARLKKEGQASAANWVKALPKPSIAAWTVNQLFWKHRGAFDRLLATGDRFRAAQAARLGGRTSDLRQVLDERREALAETTRLAADTLHRSSGSAPPGVMRRITATLEALSAYGSLPGAPRAGRLVNDVEPPGFETLAALVPRVGGKGEKRTASRLLSFRRSRPSATLTRAVPRSARQTQGERQAQITATRRARQKAERALAKARQMARACEGRLKKAALRAKQTETAMVAAEARFQKLATEAHRARQLARREAAAAEAAAQAVEEAERAVETAESTHPSTST